MAKFSLNPFRWFRKKPRPVPSAASISSPVLKPPAQPRKSGNIFLHLITLQKTLQSVDLAVRQGIDYTWLVQKAASQVSLLKLEAETVGEEELAQAAGQVLAYFETVSGERLDLDEEGVALIREFAIIFKDAIGDAVPGVRALDTRQLEQWNSRYQWLMARMKPIEVDVSPSETEEAEVEEEEVDDAAPAVEAIDEVRADGEVVVEETTEEEDEWALDESFGDKAPAAFPGEGDFIPPFDRERLVESTERERSDESDVSEPDSMEELAAYDPADEFQARDVVIPDAEIKSARESIEAGEPRPEFAERKEEPVTPTTRPPEPQRARPVPRRDEEQPVKSPVQLEEVERLKEKLLELHEKQEMLSSRMSGILGDFKKVVRGEHESHEPVSVEEFDIEDLEDLIFIGRKKG